MVWRTLLVVPALFAAMQAHATSPMSRVPIELRQTYAGGDTTTLVCEGQPAGLGQDCTFEVAEKNQPPRRYPLRISASGYYALATDYAYTELGDGAFWVAVEVDCKGRDLALVPGGTEGDTRCTLQFERDGDVVRPTSMEIRRFEGDDYRVEQRILDQRDEEAGIDIESFIRSDEVIDRCNKLARDAAKPYASNPLNLEELRRTAERMRDDRSPLFRVLQAPPAKVEAALRREPGTQLTVSVAIRDNAVRIFGDETCGVMIDEFLVPMLFPAQELIPNSELEALRKQHGVNYGHVDSWLFLLLVREAGKLQAETKLQQVADCLERSCPQIAVADALEGSREAIVQQLRAGRATPMETVSRNGRAYDVWRTMAGANLEVAIVAAFDGDAVSNATVGIVWD